MKFAEQFKNARARLGLTQSEAAAVVNMSHEWVSKCERGLTVPPAISQEGALARLRAVKTRPKAKGQNSADMRPPPGAECEIDQT